MIMKSGHKVLITYNAHRGEIQTDNGNGMYWVYDYMIMGAVLVKTADDSELPAVARTLLEKPTQPSRRFPIPCPIVLIGAATLPDGKAHVVVPAAENSGATVRYVIGVLKEVIPGSHPKP
jgi:hypothetical protein